MHERVILAFLERILLSLERIELFLLGDQEDDMGLEFWGESVEARYRVSRG